MITKDLQTRKREIEELIAKWSEDKKILEPDEVIEVEVRITKPTKVRVVIEGYHGLGNLDETSVLDLGLSVRAGNCLSNLGVETVGQLRRLTRETILDAKNMGKKCVREIQDKLLIIGVQVDWLP